MKKIPLHSELKQYLQYVRPFVLLALNNGKYNGHNMHRSFYEIFPSKTSNVPIEYNDAVYSVLKLLAHSPKNLRIEEKQHKAFNFIFEEQTEFKAGHLWGDLTGTASALYFLLKTLELYLNTFNPLTHTR